MNAQMLMETARSLVAADQGLVAMDESLSTCNRRGGCNQAASRREYDAALEVA